jgi:hypothetical protein
MDNQELRIIQRTEMDNQELRIIQPNAVLMHAYRTCMLFRAEYELLAALVRTLLLNKALQRALWFDYHVRGKVFELFLPSMLGYFDAVTLCRCEAVCSAWRTDCRRWEEQNWEALLAKDFNLSSQSFKNTSSGKKLYKECFLRLRAMMYGCGGGAGGHGGIRQLGGGVGGNSIFISR